MKSSSEKNDEMDFIMFGPKKVTPGGKLNHHNIKK